MDGSPSLQSILLAVGLILLVKQAESVSNERLIYNKLFIGSGYEKNIRPLNNSSKAIEVELEFELLKIRSVDEVNQVMTFVGFMLATWTDEYLSWNASDYGGQSKIIVPASLVWLPDFAVVNSAQAFYNADFRDEFRILIESDGKVTWDFGGTFEVSCDLSLTYYPFDMQMCYMSVENWMYDKTEVLLKNATSVIRQEDFTPNGMWNVFMTKTYSSDVYFNAFPGVAFPRVKFELFLERKPSYFQFNIVAPGAALAGLALLGMWLPADSGEKVGLGITIILAFSVYQLIIADSTPKTSDSIPILSIWMMIMLITSTIDTIVCIVVLYMHHHIPTPVPKGMRILFFQVLARALCMKSTLPDSAGPDAIIEIHNQGFEADQSGDNEIKGSSAENIPKDTSNIEASGVSKKLDHVLKHLALISKDVKDKQEESAIMDDWMAVSRITDRFFFVFNLLVIAISTVICFSLRGNIEDLLIKANQ